MGTRVVYATAALVILVGGAGCENRYADGYKDGVDEGYDLGYLDGSRGGTTAALKYQPRFILYGLACGFVFGCGVVGFFTRRYIGAELTNWRRRRQIERLLSACEPALDDDIQRQAVHIGLRKKRLEEELARGGGKLVEAAHGHLFTRLRELDTGIVRLAILMQELRTIKREISVDTEATRRKIAALELERHASRDTAEQRELDESVSIEKRRLDAALSNDKNIQRCKRKLDTLNSFLDNLIISVGNMRIVEQQEAFVQFESQVSQEIARIQTVFEHALLDLFASPGTAARKVSN